jgi:hypothetical protein
LFPKDRTDTIKFGKATGLAVLVAQSPDDEFFMVEENENFNMTVSDRLLADVEKSKGLKIGDTCPPKSGDDQELPNIRVELPTDKELPGVAFLVLDGTHRGGREPKHVFLCDSHNNTISAIVEFLFQEDLVETPTPPIPTSPVSSTVETTISQPSTTDVSPETSTEGSTSVLPSETTTSSTTTSSTTISATSTTSSSLNILDPATIATTSTPPATASTTPGDGTSGRVVTYGLQPDCGANDPNKLNICLDISSKSGEVEPWFEDIVRAKETWEDIINGDLGGPWQLSTIQKYMDVVVVATGLPDIPELDDIYIAVKEGDIDGAGGTWALAGPDLVLGDLEIVTGSMTVETEDIGPAMENDVWYPLMSKHDLQNFLKSQAHAMCTSHTYIVRHLAVHEFGHILVSAR